MGRGRAPCCEKVGLNKGSWTPEEDMRLMAYIRRFGHGNWRALPKQAGLLRCGKSCRLRWINYLRPDIKRGNFTKEEEDSIISLHGVLGNKWSKIASCLPGRTDNEIKNVWNTHLKKRLLPKDGPLRSNPEDQPQPQPSSPSTSTSAASSSNQAGPVQPADKIEIPVEPSFETVWEMLEESLNPEPSRMETAQLWDVIDDGGSRELGLAAAAADGGESSGGGGSESERWLADLEKELESWPGEVEGEDPVTSYFQTGSPSRWISY